MKNMFNSLPIIKSLYKNLHNQYARDLFVISRLKLLPNQSKILDAGCGSQRYRQNCEQLDYKDQDFGQYTTDEKKMLGAERAGDTDAYPHEAACKRLTRHKNARLLLGDSGEKDSELLKQISQPSLFWLDGHYSAGVTTSADINTPVNAELNAILRHPIKNHVILIDDASCIDATNDYPHLDELLRVVR